MAFPAGIAAVFLTLPLLAMLLRVPWLKVPALLTTPASLDALSLSLRTCLLTTVLCLILGLPLALLLSRARGRWATIGRTLAMLPMVLPPVVAGHGGTVVEWLVEDGDPVSPGQPLVRLHPEAVGA